MNSDPDWTKQPPNNQRDHFKHQEGGTHYKDMAIQPLDYIVANNMTFVEGNVIKYVTRWRQKGGVEDLKKARHYLDLLIQIQESGA